MEQVLEFAVCELTKIVEASFDDLLLEMTKKEREHSTLKERLRSLEHQENGKAGASRRRGQEKDTASPGGSEDTPDESINVPTKIIRGQKEQLETTHEGDKQAVLTVAQDWVPILDKVFGQKWCSDLWQIQELSSDKGGEERSGGCPLPSLNALIRDNLEPSPTCPTQDPQWMPLEDMEVLSSTSDSQKDPPPSIRTTATGKHAGESLRSPSMLHRLLTLPAQLLEEEDENTMEMLPAVSEASSDRGESWPDTESPSQSSPCPLKRKVAIAQEEDEDEDDDDKGLSALDSKVNTESLKGRKTHRCKECGKKFSRALLLKTHQQTHVAATPAIRCSECGKRFSQASRLQAHLRMHSGKKS
ncbi:protein glass isoform X1 [Esox lucius]|uniref:protein glass isoform X1 n=1 Tax=Esox lucius TaxID=8010 RepID=UPI001476C5F0|nr:protein glass isoform X1 [Esox lucius]XP_034151118.1 protein glass isoform X1 [Esox lucius]